MAWCVGVGGGTGERVGARPDEVGSYCRLALGSGRSRPLPASKPGHQLAKDRRVILGLGMPTGSLDAEMQQGLTQSCERATIERARQIV